MRSSVEMDGLVSHGNILSYQTESRANGPRDKMAGLRQGSSVLLALFSEIRIGVSAHQ